MQISKFQICMITMKLQFIEIIYYGKIQWNLLGIINYLLREPCNCNLLRFGATWIRKWWWAVNNTVIITIFKAKSTTTWLITLNYSTYLLTFTSWIKLYFLKQLLAYLIQKCKIVKPCATQTNHAVGWGTQLKILNFYFELFNLLHLQS